MALTNPDNFIRPLDTQATGSVVKGIFAPDVVIKNLLDTGLADLRANKWELELIFAYMMDDPKLGDKERQRAISWFINTDIPVLWNLSLRPDTFPSVSFSLIGGEQQEETLASLHYDGQENKLAEWEPITPKFNPNYDPVTGIVTIPPTILDLVSINNRMVMVTGRGVSFPLTYLKYDNTFPIAKGLIVDLKDSVIKNIDSRLLSKVESVSFKEIIRVGIHSINDPVTAIWLFSIVKYVLLKYNRVLLEGRGFECLSMSYGPYDKDPNFPVENVTSRLITITGKARDNWSSLQSERASNVSVGLKVSPISTETDNTSNFMPEPENEDPAWAAFLSSDITGASR
jgi:hypothetical protein